MTALAAIRNAAHHVPGSGDAAGKSGVIGPLTALSLTGTRFGKP